MKINIIYLFLSVACMSGCINGNMAADDSLPTLDIESAVDNPRRFDLAEISDKIEFIALDDADQNALVGKITDIAESKNGFYIHDEWKRPVKVFDRSGKFIATRGLIGRGPNEVSQISDIAVDHGSGNLYVNGGAMAYDTDGQMFARNDSISGESRMAFFDGQLVVSRPSYYH